MALSPLLRKFNRPTPRLAQSEEGELMASSGERRNLPYVGVHIRIRGPALSKPEIAQLNDRRLIRPQLRFVQQRVVQLQVSACNQQELACCF